MMDIFGAENGSAVRGLCIVDDGGLQEVKLRFDFVGLTLEDCIFVGYTDLWSCRADSTTRFNGCRIQGCQGAPSIRAGLRGANFGSSCVMDGAALRSIKAVSAKVGARRLQAEGAVRGLLGDFGSRSKGISGAIRKEHMRDRYKSDGLFGFTEVWERLLKQGVIIEDAAQKYKINPQLAKKVGKFLFDALPFEEVDVVVSELAR
jgi:hypothetical protein